MGILSSGPMTPFVVARKMIPTANRLAAILSHNFIDFPGVGREVPIRSLDNVIAIA
jgi:hypothetical protein